VNRSVIVVSVTLIWRKAVPVAAIHIIAMKLRILVSFKLADGRKIAKPPNRQIKIITKHTA